MIKFRRFEDLFDGGGETLKCYMAVVDGTDIGCVRQIAYAKRGDTLRGRDGTLLLSPEHGRAWCYWNSDHSYRTRRAAAVALLDEYNEHPELRDKLLKPIETPEDFNEWMREQP